MIPDLQSATAADATAIAALDARVNASPWSSDAVRETLERAAGFVLRAADGTLCGFVLFAVAADECEILDIAVDPARRRAGHATRLLDAALGVAAARGAVHCFLEVRESNVSACNFYRSMGFLAAGQRRDYYRTVDGRENALLMTRAIILGSQSCRS